MGKLQIRKVDKLEDYISVVEEFGSNNSTRWYRGCGKSNHKLLPSLYRHQKAKTIEELLKMENRLLTRFCQRSIPFHSRPMATDWEWLFLMQHFGIPTRLLDWTESPLIALFFAVTSTQCEFTATGRLRFHNDCSVWILDAVEWNKHAVDLNSFDGRVLNTGDAHATSYQPRGDCESMKDLPIAIFGAHNSQRIVAQRGVFVCFGKKTDPMERLYDDFDFPAESLIRLDFKKSRLPYFVEALRRHGVSDSVVFPDLDGLAREIKREHNFEV